MTWLDRNSVQINRFFFWWSAVMVVFCVAGAVIEAVNHEWGWIFLWLFGISLMVVIAFSADDDLKADKLKRGMSTGPPAWRKRLRRTVHVALWGWS